MSRSRLAAALALFAAASWAVLGGAGPLPVFPGPDPDETAEIQLEDEITVCRREAPQWREGCQCSETTCDGAGNCTTVVWTSARTCYRCTALAASHADFCDGCEC